MRGSKNTGFLAGWVPAVLYRSVMGRDAFRYMRFLLWFTLAAAYVSLASRWITLEIHDRAFAQYLDHVVQLAANEDRPAREVRTLLLVKAVDLSLPVNEDAIRVSGGGSGDLRAVVRYEADLRLPILEHLVYRIGFEHDLTRSK